MLKYFHYSFMFFIISGISENPLDSKQNNYYVLRTKILFTYFKNLNEYFNGLFCVLFIEKSSNIDYFYY